MKRNLLPLAGLLACLLLGAESALAAINPDNFKRFAPYVVRLREVTRIVHTDNKGADKLRRVTIVALVLEIHKSRDVRLGDTIVIDYTVNLTWLERAAKEHADRQGNMPGPQFLSEPEPPQTDEKGAFWAHLAKVSDGLGNDKSDQASSAGIIDYAFRVPVFRPDAKQYSFTYP